MKFNKVNSSKDDRYASGRAKGSSFFSTLSLVRCPSSRSPYSVRYTINGQQTRKAFADRGEAQAFLNMVRQVMLQAEKFVEQHVGTQAGCDMQAECRKYDVVVAEYLAAKKEQSRSKVTLRTLSVELQAFGNVTGVVDMADITPKVVHGYVYAKGLSNRTQVNRWLRMSGFLTWCAHPVRAYVDSNPIHMVEKPVTVALDRAPSTIDLAQADRVLDVARKMRRLKVVALQLLAGLRPGEAAELPVTSIADDYIAVIGVGKMKNKCRRLVPVCPRLKAILDEVRDKKQQRKLDTVTRKQLEKLSGVDIEQDALRHTWVSYRVAQVGITQAAAEAGNSPGVVTRHYLDPRKKEDADKFFG